MNESGLISTALPLPSAAPLPFTSFTSDSFPATVFDIHLLQCYICSLLNPQSLRRCTLVSRDFYLAFNPHLWKKIYIHHRITYDRFLRPEALAALTRYASLVTHVSSAFASVWPLFLQAQCSNFVLLDSPSLPSQTNQEVNQDSSQESNKKYLPSILQLLRSSPRLCTLRLGHFNYELDAVECFFATVRQHPSLKELEIDHVSDVSSRHVQTMLWSTLKLDRFSLNVVEMLHRPGDQLRMELPDLVALTGEVEPQFGLKELILPGLTCQHDTLYYFLKRCPYVERMVFPSFSWYPQAFILASMMESTLTRLSHVDISTAWATGPMVAAIIQSCRRLVSFVGSRNHHEPQAILLAILDKHAESLESLKMRCDNAVPSALILRLLSSCPALEVLNMLFSELCWISDPEEESCARTRENGDVFLDTTELYEFHAETSAPWICEKLRVFRISYATDDSIDHEKTQEMFPRVLYDRLSVLTDLEDLRLRLIPRPRTSASPTEPGATLLLNPSTNGGVESTQNAKDIGGQQQLSPLQREEKLLVRRIQNVTDALLALTSLTKLKKLELRGLEGFIDKAALKKARGQWKRIKWIQCL